MQGGDYPVVLYVYDLSGGLAKALSQAIIGKQIDGIWHTGLVVYSQEFYFGGGICKGPPGMTPYGKPVQTIELGKTSIPQSVFLDFLNDISPGFTIATYDLMKNNCNNFTDVCAEFLLGEGIPKHIVNLPQDALSTPMGQQILGMLGGGNNIMDPRSFEGANNPQSMHLGEQGVPQAQSQARKQTQQPPPQPQTGVIELIGQPSFNEAIKNCTACVIDVYTEWCGPCKNIKPFFATLPRTHPELKFFKVYSILNLRWIWRRITSFQALMESSRFQPSFSSIRVINGLNI